MISLILIAGVVFLIPLSFVRSRIIHYFFIFAIFSYCCFVASYSETLGDIQVYRDAFYAENKFDTRFEIGFQAFLYIVDTLNFNFVYAISMGFSASITYAILTYFCSARVYLSALLFILIYSPQFILAWRQALMYPGLLYFFLTFFVFHTNRFSAKRIFSIGFASPLLFFHSFGTVGFFVALAKLDRKILLATLCLLLGFVIYFDAYFSFVWDFLLSKFSDGQSYIDEQITTSFRQLLVVLKFILLYFIFNRSIDNLREIGVNISVIRMMILLKIILSLIAVFHVHPVYGRINGVLCFVDFFVILASNGRIWPITTGYVLFSFLSSIVFNPYYNH
jgi:hypothetical protein